ncbi:hypothetical protein MWH28_07875 [Natroniella sulfidigena]|uniref:hypothetical protein n=1 Tax=Natroniella sulfidigena TaxID=723921 RepID=UPI002009F9F1|nr:hypothetical protein [Natroniella sulfidigena]MCK8817278.1 hypothetical protein [Natroniella sulfidigena]
MKLKSADKTADYDQLMDQQFDLLQQMIDLSNDIIHQDYKDDELLEKGNELLSTMLTLNKLNYYLVENFPDEKEIRFIREQYRTSDVGPLDKIKEEINMLNIHLMELETLKQREKREEDWEREEELNDLRWIANRNLTEYETALGDIFKENSN